MSTGVELFASELTKMGFEVSVDGSWVEFDYVVPGGRYEGRKIRLAINVPPEFSRNPPGGIDFRPRLRPVHQGGEHPERSHPTRRPGWTDGEYWSRPFKQWAQQSHQNARTYMAHVHNLWMTT